jgi:hypothetical protein
MQHASTNIKKVVVGQHLPRMNCSGGLNAIRLRCDERRRITWRRGGIQTSPKSQLAGASFLFVSIVLAELHA